MARDPHAADADARLTALDPFAGASYAHPEPEAMVARIAAGEPRRRPRRRRDVLAPVAGLLATGLATIGLALASTPAPTLSPLALSSMSSHAASAPSRSAMLFVEGGQLVPAATSTKAYAFSAPATWSNASFSPSSDGLVAGIASAPTLEAVAVERPSGIVRAAAGVLGLGEPASAQRASSERASSGGLATSLRRDASTGLEVLRLGVAGVPSCATSRSFRAFRSTATSMVATLSGVVTRLGLPYRLAEPRVSAGAGRVAGVCSAVASLTEQVAVAGAATDQVAIATFGPSGELLSATLPVFSVSRTERFPLLSPEQALAPLVQATSNLALQSVTSVGKQGAHVALPVQGAASVAVATIEVRAATLALRTFRALDGSTWLVPVYVLSGDRYPAAAGAAPSPWTGVVLATRSGVRVVGAGALGVMDEATGPGPR
jgi:hypothetical protein